MAQPPLRERFSRELPGSALSRLPLVRQALREFERSTGLPAVIVSAESVDRPMRLSRMSPAFCRICREVSGHRGAGECWRVQRECCQRLTAKWRPCSIQCRAGLVQMAVPVVVEGRHWATILAGKVRVGAAPHGCGRVPQAARRYWAAIQAHPEGLRMWEMTPLVTGQQWKAAMGLLDILARLIGQALSGRGGWRISRADPIPIASAKRYIEKHLEERITTGQMARAAGLNVSYFCRLFHRVTGITPHAYLAQVRVETAKAALRTTAQSVSEIGFVSGFQSVSDFSRVFKAQVGMSPRAFRRTAAAGVPEPPRGNHTSNQVKRKSNSV